MERVKSKVSLRWPSREVETFFDSWNPEVAYVLGFFAADGSMYKNQRGSCYLGFYSADKFQIELIRNLLGVSNKLESYKSQHKNHQQKYTLQIGSQKTYNRLLDLGFTPKKSLTLGFPDCPDDLIPHFVRGYFDGDGCVYYRNYFRRDRGKSYPLLMVRFTCGSKRFLEILREKISLHTSVGLGSLHPHTTAWDLSYSTNDSRQLYRFMYPRPTVPCLSRKKAIFEQAFKELYKNGPVV